ncbi:aldehyde dehydrogenase family protein [Streptomyces sp. NPDC048550]|uniref:aldehyde dehydrogenase family protein n=1 Tax=Streptomyces sp. NPDC048550 TaxID=3155739 RepID=UPI003429EC5E
MNDSAFRPGVIPGSAEPIAVICPATGEQVAAVPSRSAAEVRALVSTVRSAQPAWEAGGLAARVRRLRQLREWLWENERRLTDLLQAETGRPRQEAALETAVCADLITYFTRNAERWLRDQRPRPHNLLTVTKRLVMTRRPYPVVGIVSSWNFPLFLALCDAVPALLAGAAVVVKPSEFAPLAVRETVRGWREDLAAPEVFVEATGTGATGEAVVGAVDYVQFTGSVRTGRAVARLAAERLIPCSLELGGKDAMIVLADADLERAANAAVWGSMFNSGQVCVSVERLYVEDAVYEPFLDLVVHRVRELRSGSSAAHSTGATHDVGPIVTGDQLALVKAHVADAVARGAEIVMGGRAPEGPGTFYEPTVLTGVDHSMLCMREETFGPLLPVMKVSDVDEAVRLANDSELGLSATVWTGNRARGEAIARRLQTGAVNINDVFTNLFALPLPHTGWKNSGPGSRLGGAAALHKYCRSQAITSPRIAPRRELLWYPYLPRKQQALMRALRAITARGPQRFFPSSADEGGTR